MQSLNSFYARYSWQIDLFLLSLLIGFFYFLWLGSYPLFIPDEGRYPEVAREMLAAGDFITPRVNTIAFLDKPVLYYWLEAAAMAVFGINEWAVRFFPALFGVAGSLITYVCGRLLFNRRTALIASAILATTPLFFGCAHYADLNLEVAALISITLLCFITAVQNEQMIRKKFLFAAYIFSAFAFLTKGLIGIAFPVMIAGSWIVITNRWRLLTKIHLITGIILFLMIVSPWYVLAQQANPYFFHYFFVTQQVSRFLSSGEFNNATPFWFYLPIILIGFFPWTVFILQACVFNIKCCYRELKNHQAELFLLLWSSIILIFFSIPHSKTTGYILPILPALALLTANYLDNKWKQNQLIYFFIAGCFIFSGTLYFVAKYYLSKFTVNLNHYLISISILFLVTAVFAGLLRYKKTLLSVILLGVIGNVIFLSSLALNISSINDYSAKPLALHLKKIITPNDIVVSYFQFHQDIPMYLGRTLLIAADWNAEKIMHTDNWQRELLLGAQFQKNNHVLLSEQDFWKKWHGKNRVYVFITKNYFEQFTAKNPHYVVVDKTPTIYLVRNLAQE